MMGSRITQEEFGRLLATFDSRAFRLETRDTYHLTYERDDFAWFLVGDPVAPAEVSWWRPWLDQIPTMRREGKTIARVRVIAEPPTDYQR